MASGLADTSHGEHLVAFYDDGEHLAALAAQFFASSLSSGGTALLVATPAHTGLIRQALDRCGIDAGAAVLERRLVVLDAAQTLARFTPNGCSPDASLFDEVVGGALDGLVAAGRPVAVFGEMVALLWADGNVASALTLEALWNGLAADRRDFRLLCGYAMAALDRAGGTDGFLQVCTLHDTVIPHEGADGDAGDFVSSVVSGLRDGILRRGEELLAAARDTIADIDRRFAPSLPAPPDTSV